MWTFYYFYSYGINEMFHEILASLVICFRTLSFCWKHIWWYRYTLNRYTHFTSFYFLNQCDILRVSPKYLSETQITTYGSVKRITNNNGIRKLTCNEFEPIFIKNILNPKYLLHTHHNKMVQCKGLAELFLKWQDVCYSSRG